MNRSKTFIFLISLITLILISLGFWQLSRLKEKDIYITRIQNNVCSNPISLNEIKRSDFLFSKVKIRGRFLPEKDIYLYGRYLNRQNGYYLISPFATEDNKIILIARGWIDYKIKNSFEPQNSSATEIAGVILNGEKTRLFVPQNDLKTNTWFTLDLKQASEFLNLPIENYYIIQASDNNCERADLMIKREANDSLNPLRPIEYSSLLKIRNNHLEYSITWFLLAFAVIVSFAIYIRKSS